MELANEEIQYPSIVFKLQGQLFSMSSRHILTIIQRPEYNKLPYSPAHSLGVFYYRGELIHLVDLRTFLGKPPLQEEFTQFEEMLEARKQDHIRWVKELNHSVHTNTPFTLAKDPHQCAFGKWYDNFESDNQSVQFQLKKIDQPHQQLHHAAHEVDDCVKNLSGEALERGLEEILSRVETQYMPNVVRLLDETKETFQHTVFREMALLLECGIALMVDEVLSVELLPSAESLSGSVQEHTKCISGVVRCKKHKSEILELNLPFLLRSVGAVAV